MSDHSTETKAISLDFNDYRLVVYREKGRKAKTTLLIEALRNSGESAAHSKIVIDALLVGTTR